MGKNAAVGVKPRPPESNGCDAHVQELSKSGL